MKIIAANIPRITVGIVRWILKIIKLLLFLSPLSICHCGRLLTPCTCAQCRKSVWIESQTDNGDIISTLGDNCPLIGRPSICPPCPLPLRCHQRSSEPESDQDILSCDKWHASWWWPHRQCHTSPDTQTQPLITDGHHSDQIWPVPLSDVTSHVLSGPHRDQEWGHLTLSGRGNVPCPPVARVITAGQGIKYPPGQRVCVQCLMILPGCLVSGLLTWWLLIHVNCKCSKLPLRRSPVARTTGDTLACHQTTLVLSRACIITSDLRFLPCRGSTEQDSHKVIFIDCYKSISSDS